MAITLQQYSLYSHNLGVTLLKKTLSLPKNVEILSVHENVIKGIPCSGLGISVLEDTEIQELEKYEFLIFPICASKTEHVSLDQYKFIGTTKDCNSSYYNVFYKIVR